jgi:hypothetical protein
MLSRSLPDSSIAVYREDLSNDGLADFVLENVDEEISGARDIIILTSRGEGKMPAKLIEQTPEFLDLVSRIESALENVNEMLSHYRGQTCAPQTVGIDWTCPDGEVVGGPTSICNDITESPAPRPRIVVICSNNSLLPTYAGDYGIFCGGMSAFSSSTGTDVSSGSAAVEEALARARNGQVIRGSTGVMKTARDVDVLRNTLLRKRLLRRAAMTVAVGLFADDVTVVGVIDDIGAVALLISAGYSLYQEAALEADLARINEAKIREVAQDVAYDPAKDPYRWREECQPWNDADVQQKAPTTASGTSKRLRENLQLQGCECPPGTAAHHIAAKKAGGAGGDRLRVCLENAGINIDWAGNGICLPKNRNDRHIASGRSRIAGHDDSGLHKWSNIAALADACEAVSNHLPQDSSARFEAVKNFLNQTRSSLHHYQVVP